MLLESLHMFALGQLIAYLQSFLQEDSLVQESVEYFLLSQHGLGFLRIALGLLLLVGLLALRLFDSVEGCVDLVIVFKILLRLELIVDLSIFVEVITGLPRNLFFR